MTLRKGPLVFVILFVSACTTPRHEPASSIAPRSEPSVEHPMFSQTGFASWYGKTHNGRLTANGERFDMGAMTAAHRDLPFNSVVRVTNVQTGETVKLRINDRGPYEHGRIIDLSAAAAAQLGIAEAGTALVRIEVFASDQPHGPGGTLEQAAQP